MYLSINRNLLQTSCVIRPIGGKKDIICGEQTSLQCGYFYFPRDSLQHDTIRYPRTSKSNSVKSRLNFTTLQWILDFYLSILLFLAFIVCFTVGRKGINSLFFSSSLLVNVFVVSGLVLKHLYMKWIIQAWFLSIRRIIGRNRSFTI